MKPQLLALITALAWGVGGYFEKQGLHVGHLPAQMGIAIRSAVAFAVLGAVGLPHWKTIPQAGSKSLAMMILGGGILAGSIGMLCFYAAIKGAPLGRVMPIAFTAPLFGALLGAVFGGETLAWRDILGIALTTGGIVLLTTR
jgi:transporter family protein